MMDESLDRLPVVCIVCFFLFMALVGVGHVVNRISDNHVEMARIAASVAQYQGCGK